MESPSPLGETETFLLNASWTSLDEGVVNFRKDWLAGRRPTLRWGAERLPVAGLKRAPLSDFGNHSGYFVDADELFFVLRRDRFPGADLEAREVFVAGNFNGWEQAIGDFRWQLQPQTLDRQPFFVLGVSREVLDWNRPHVFKFVTGDGHWLDVAADATNVVVDEMGNRNYRIRPQQTGRHRFFFRTPQPLGQSSSAHLVYEQGDYTETVAMNPGVFIKQLTSDLPLGAMVEAGKTTFRLFAPRARCVRLHLSEGLRAVPVEGIEMRTHDNLVWETVVPGNRNGWFYHYTVSGDEEDGFSYFDGSFPILDPYAKACVGPLGPGIVVAPERFERRHRERFHPPAWHDLVIAEIHLRDVLARAAIELTEDERLGYRGLTAWLQEEACYLRELGINAVELQPIQEFDTVDPKEYGWGYMPVNYFSPASQYAGAPQEGSQIEEFRALVDAFHRAGIAVIIDVVYNHVGNPNYLQFIDKGYYFLLDGNGEYMNFSGCGNTIDPDTPMARRLMIESLVHFLEAYDVDGFRFDLGELIGIDCLQEIEQAVKAVKPGVFLVAEPWSFRAHLGARMMETGIAAWNDGFRECIRGYVLGHENPEGLLHFMQGSRGTLAAFPAQTVNYLCSHDDRVWIDKITENPACDGTAPTPHDRRRTHLAISVLMMSVGIPMLHAGDDFLFSKGGRNNTYLDGPANELPYERLRFFSGTHDYCRSWIRFRHSEAGRLLRLDGHPEPGFFVSWSEGKGVGMLYNAALQMGREQLIFAVNPDPDTARLRLEGVALRHFQQWADHERFVHGGLPTARFICGEDWIELPPMSCGLWVRDSG